MDTYRDTLLAEDQRSAPAAFFARWLPAPEQRFGVWALLILLLGGYVQSRLVLDPDLAWLLTLDGKWLAGQRLYADLFEVNPPISALIYLPPMLLAKLTGFGVADATTALMLLLDCGAVAATVRILRPQFETREIALRFALVLLFLFVVFPTDVFGQRDYMAVVALTPFVAMAAARGLDERPGPWLAVLAGLGAGLAMAIKPQYALIAGAPLIWNAVSKRRAGALFPAEMWVASAVVIAYGGASLALFPAYFGPYLGRLLLAYLSVPREFPGRLWPLSIIAALVVASLACARFAGDPRARRFAAPWLAASLGGLALYVQLGKWWTYNGYGMLALALVPLLASLTLAGDRRPLYLKWAARLAAIAACFAGMQWLFVGPELDGLEGPVASVAPPHPSVISITDDIAVGHPLVTALNGEWAGTSAAHVLAGGAIRLEQIGGMSAARREALNAVIAYDRDRLRADIARGRPDIIVSDTRLLGVAYFDWWRWANQDPALAALLSGYRRVGVWRHRIEIWKRADITAGANQITLSPEDVQSEGP